MCCFLLHDILKIKFEGLNLMRCCAKSNKYYQYICKIGSVNLISLVLFFIVEFFFLLTNDCFIAIEMVQAIKK